MPCENSIIPSQASAWAWAHGHWAFWLLCPVDLEAAPDFFGDFPGHLLTGALTALRALPMDDETLGSGEGGLWLFGFRALGLGALKVGV